MGGPWPVPRLNLHGVPPSLQGCAGLGLPPPEDNTSVHTDFAAAPPVSVVRAAQRDHDDTRDARVCANTFGVESGRHCLVPKLDFHGVPLSLQGCSGLGIAPPEDVLLEHVLPPAASRPVSMRHLGTERAEQGSSSNFPESADAPRHMAHVQGSTKLPCAQACPRDMPMGRVPKLNLKDLPPSVQGCYGLGLPPPEEATAALAVAQAGTHPDEHRTCSTLPSACGSSIRGPIVTRQRTWSIPRLNFWGLPPSLQGWLGYAMRLPAASREEEPSTLQSDSAEVSAAVSVSVSTAESDGDLSNSGNGSVIGSTGVLDLAPTQVPRLNLRGLPSPQIYQAWPDVANTWTLWSQQRAVEAPREPHLVVLPPTVQWSPVAGAPQCAICLLDFDTTCQVSVLRCKHVFHGECIRRWLSNQARCPLCRGAC